MLSLSVIVNVVFAEPSVAPVGLLKATLNVSGPSAYTSSTIGIEMVFELSPGAKVSVPMVVR
jgi:hypothetical protein